MKEKWASRFAVLSSSFPALASCPRRRHGASICPGGRASGARACRVHRRSRAERLARRRAASRGRRARGQARRLGACAFPRRDRADGRGASCLAQRTARCSRVSSRRFPLSSPSTAAAFLSGGVFSPAVAWLVLAPVEALEHPSRREAIIISLAAILGAVALAIFAACGWTPAPAPSSSVIAPALVVTALVFAAMRVLKASDAAVAAELALSRLRESNRLRPRKSERSVHAPRRRPAPAPLPRARPGLSARRRSK